MYISMLSVFILTGGLATSVADNPYLHSSYLQLDYNCPEANSFVCANSRCIPKSKRCDGVDDCLDRSDELYCDTYHCEAPIWFRCKNDMCISAAFKCDGEDECGDNSDEMNCENSQATTDSTTSILPPVACHAADWLCDDKHFCVDRKFLCDGQSDCIDGSDEKRGCAEGHECPGFRCKNGLCIVTSWVCDGVIDCGSNEDEQHCEVHTDPSECNLDNRKYLCSDGLTCLRLEQLCDGKKNCPDGSDESDVCQTSSCNATSCSHDCFVFPNGAKCICPSGYHTVNEKQCIDINECETYGICDQKCRNTEGSYQCYCDAKYKLQDDKRTCRISGGEAILLYTSKTHVRGYFIEMQELFEIANNLKQVVGVAYDGHHVYWTEIYSEHESIVRASEDGSNREHVVTSGLGAPEDLAVDWVTGNIYFTDSEMQHIGVCTKGGNHCTVIVNKDIHKPRGIALNPTEGEMYWSDWGDHPQIAKALMDGTKDTSLVSRDIAWPNGLTIDHPNGRLYWADAKMMTLESIRLDGTDRRIVLQDIVKHPYGLAVFEDKLYWSDWTTQSIASCNKFTGKNYSRLVRENNNHIYGVHIYHSALKSNRTNPCKYSICSDICLLSGHGYSCACPDDKNLSDDKHICKVNEKKQMLVAGIKHHLVQIEHKTLGKHNVMSLPTTATDITSLAYSSHNNTLFIGDKTSRSIITMNLNTGDSKTLYQLAEPSEIASIVYDYLGNNLFYCDSGMRTVNVLSLNTMEMKPLMHDFGDDIPKAITVVPEDGVMFVGFEKKSDVMQWYIDRFRTDGTGRTHAVFKDIEGPITLYYESDLHRVFWTDAYNGQIESMNVNGDDRKQMRAVTAYPSGLSSLSNDLFWTNGGKAELMWIDKRAMDYSKRVMLDLPQDDIETALSLVAVTPLQMHLHACQYNNGNCSHICLAAHREGIQCVCPIGMDLSADNRTCVKPVQCSSEEFHCTKADTCIPMTMHCNGRSDCATGEDEIDCDRKYECPFGTFECGDGECISSNAVCDMHFDCKDRSDESECGSHPSNRCLPHQFRCPTGLCIDMAFVCDGTNECVNGEDERNCDHMSCGNDYFRCTGGRCIPKSWECDNEYDCPDMSDEHSGCSNVSCTEGKFKCSNGRCIEPEMKCDGTDDCGDLSDELSCHLPQGCLLHEYQCTSDPTICIPLAARCNGTAECPHREDEASCSDCHINEFQCPNNRCISRDWLCDGANDCGDPTAADENNDLCSTNTSVPAGKVWAKCDGGFRCRDGHCVDVTLVCDKKNDCLDASDENGACETSCLYNSNPCSQQCVKTPSGPMCTCRDGFKLMGDGQTCEDIAECKKIPPVCSQMCTEMDGSYACSCYNGFALRADKKSCKSDGEPATIFYTVDNEIRSLSTVKNDLSILYELDNSGISGLDVDVHNQYVYFTLKEEGRVLRMPLNGKPINGVFLMNNPTLLATDWITQNIYVSQGTDGNRYIMGCTHKTAQCTKLITLDPSMQLTAIAIDPINRFLFYSMSKWHSIMNPQSKIFKRSLNGLKQWNILTVDNRHISGLALDVNTKSLYFVDQLYGDVVKTSYDGLNEKVVFANRSRPHHVQLFEDTLYFLERHGAMTKCKLYGAMVCETFRLSAYTSQFFAIMQESRQPWRFDMCADSNCSGVCYPTDVGPVCMCNDGSLMPHSGECPQGGQEFTPIHHSSEIIEKSHGTAITAIVICVLISLIVIGVAAYILFYRRRHTGLFSVPSVQFSNAMFQGLRTNDKSSGVMQSLIEEESGSGVSPVDLCARDMQAASDAILQKINPLIKIDD